MKFFFFNFFLYGSKTPDLHRDENSGIRYKLLRHVSFVDCRGHDILMATMLNGAADAIPNIMLKYYVKAR